MIDWCTSLWNKPLALYIMAVDSSNERYWFSLISADFDCFPQMMTNWPTLSLYSVSQASALSSLSRSPVRISNPKLIQFLWILFKLHWRVPFSICEVSSFRFTFGCFLFSPSVSLKLTLAGSPEFDVLLRKSAERMKETERDTLNPNILIFLQALVLLSLALISYISFALMWKSCTKTRCVFIFSLFFIPSFTLNKGAAE